MTTIPICDPAVEYAECKEEIDAAIAGVLASGRYILGPNVTSFEEEMAGYLGCGRAIGVNSGTDALHLALRGLGIGPGDEVITTPFTFVATTEAIGMVGATPVFADVDPRTFNIDPASVEAAVTPWTKAILPVHLFGQPCDMDAILAIARSNGVYVVEDCAQALGATYKGRRVGTLGDAGCLSFFPTKNLGCFGDGGMLTTSNADLGDRVETLRRHGGRVKYRHDELGLNSRLDEVQAAVLRVKLPRLDAFNDRRRLAARRYDHALASIDGVALPYRSLEDDPQATAVYHQYTVQLEDRDAAREYLAKADVQSFPYYPIPLHLQAVHSELGHQPGDFPVAEDLARNCLSLPMFPQLTEARQERVAAAVRGYRQLATAA